jgi:hypothetical protein
MGTVDLFFIMFSILFNKNLVNFKFSIILLRPNIAKSPAVESCRMSRIFLNGPIAKK